MPKPKPTDPVHLCFKMLSRFKRDLAIQSRLITYHEDCEQFDVSFLKVTPDSRPEVKQCYLFHACYYGDEDAVLSLLTLGAELDGTGRWAWERTPLMFAAAGGHSQLVRVLVEIGANPFLRDKYGFGLLHYATLSQDPATLGVCVYDVGCSEQDGNCLKTTPLMLAAACQLPRSVLWLRRSSSHLTRDQCGWNYQRYAVKSGSDVMKYMCLRAAAVRKTVSPRLRDVLLRFPLAMQKKELCKATCRTQ